MVLTGGSRSILWPCPGVAHQQLIAVLLEVHGMAVEQKRQLGPPEDMALTTGEFAKPNEPIGALDNEFILQSLQCCPFLSCGIF